MYMYIYTEMSGRFYKVINASFEKLNNQMTFYFLQKRKKSTNTKTKS